MNEKLIVMGVERLFHGSGWRRQVHAQQAFSTGINWCHAQVFLQSSFLQALSIARNVELRDAFIWVRMYTGDAGLPNRSVPCSSRVTGICDCQTTLPFLRCTTKFVGTPGTGLNNRHARKSWCPNDWKDFCFCTVRAVPRLLKICLQRYSAKHTPR